MFREIASLLDTAKSNDVQMLGFKIEICARTSDASGVVAKAQAIDGVTAVSEPDDI